MKRARRNAELPRRRTYKNCRRYAHGNSLPVKPGETGAPPAGKPGAARTPPAPRPRRSPGPWPKLRRLGPPGSGNCARAAGAQTLRRLDAAVNLRRPRMPNAHAVAAMAPDQVAAPNRSSHKGRPNHNHYTTHRRTNTNRGHSSRRRTDNNCRRRRNSIELFARARSVRRKKERFRHCRRGLLRAIGERQ